MDLTITHRGKHLMLTPSPTGTTTIGELRCQISSHLSLPSSHIRLLCQGKQLTNDEQPLHPTVTSKAIILVLATSPSTASEIRRLDNISNIRSSGIYHSRPLHTTSLQSSKTYFNNIEALSEFNDVHVAKGILQSLAYDKGFCWVMREKGWNVGALREMKPYGKVGNEPCVLGYNVNKGEEIRLRLRTDDLDGFRSIGLIRKTLAHELAHNVHGEHDNKFKELMRWIEKQVERINAQGKRIDGENEQIERMKPELRFAKEERFKGNVGKLGIGAASSKDDDGMHNSRLLKFEKKQDKKEKQEEKQKKDNNINCSNDHIQSTNSPTDDTNTQSIPVTTLTASNTAHAQLCGMGFNEYVSKIALIETDGDITASVNWIMSRQSRDTNKIEELINGLKEESCGEEEIGICLYTLHRYLSDAQNGRKERINKENRLFQQRIGRFRNARMILKKANFKEDEQSWIVGKGVEVAKVKLQLERAIVRVLQIN